MIRNLKIKQGLGEGRTIKELAEEYGLSERTIRRVVAPPDAGNCFPLKNALFGGGGCVKTSSLAGINNFYRGKR